MRSEPYQCNQLVFDFEYGRVVWCRLTVLEDPMWIVNEYILIMCDRKMKVSSTWHRAEPLQKAKDRSLVWCVWLCSSDIFFWHRPKLSVLSVFDESLVLFASSSLVVLLYLIRFADTASSSGVGVVRTGLFAVFADAVDLQNYY